MIIENNPTKGVRLVRLTEEYIELVRIKRNMPDIQKTMEFREPITPEMQKSWFSAINNINNLFFLVEVNKTYIGLVYGAKIDWKQGIVDNGGIFIWDEHYLQSPEVVQASVLLTDFGFFLGIKKNYVRVLNDNSVAIQYNKSLGYKLLPNQDGVYNQRYELTAEAYFNATKRIRSGTDVIPPIKILITKQEYTTIHKIQTLTGVDSGKIIFNFIA